jgi:hypothetical protein
VAGRVTQELYHCEVGTWNLRLREECTLLISEAWIFGRGGRLPSYLNRSLRGMGSLGARFGWDSWSRERKSLVDGPVEAMMVERFGASLDVVGSGGIVGIVAGLVNYSCSVSVAFAGRASGVRGKWASATLDRCMGHTQPDEPVLVEQFRTRIVIFLADMLIVADAKAKLAIETRLVYLEIEGLET